MNVGILGMGEVGKAMAQLCRKHFTVVTRDLQKDDFSKVASIDVLHICIPFSANFTSIVEKVITEYQPHLVIIDSTISPGTTGAIFKKTNVHIVHAPVMGKHPNLAAYQKKFRKAIGAVDDESFRLAKDHFTTLGITTVRFDSPLETELAKLLDTTYYAWNIFFEKWVWSICKENGVNFSQSYGVFNSIYNDGYKEELPHVQRPILLHNAGPIGGHCVIPNIKILKKWLGNDDFIDFMIDENQKLQKKLTKKQ